jgi:hypothetical protein
MEDSEQALVDSDDDDLWGDDDEYNTGDWSTDPCPPHLLALCDHCGYDVCSDCDKHHINGEDVDECPGLTATSSSPATGG